MDFTVEQRFVAPPDAVARAYASTELYDVLHDLPRLGGAEVLAHDAEDDGDTVRMQIRYRFTGDLSSAARAMLDPARLTWVEHSVHDLAARRVTYRLQPDHYANRLQSSGEYRFEAAGDGTLRRARGMVKVKALVVGSLVEGAIVSGLREHLAAEAPRVDQFLAAR